LAACENAVLSSDGGGPQDQGLDAGKWGAASDASSGPASDASSDASIEGAADASSDASIDGASDASSDASVEDAGTPCRWVTVEDGGRRAQMLAAWDVVQLTERQRLAAALDAGSTGAMYNVQLLTAQLLMHADYTSDLPLLESLAEVYTPAFELAPTRSLVHHYYASQPDGGAMVRDTIWPLPRPMKIWARLTSPGVVEDESILDASQFLYAASRLIRIASEFQTPSPALRRFVELALRITVDDHYERWVQRAPGTPGQFQVRGWGCHEGTFDHFEHLANLLSRKYGTNLLPGAISGAPRYCNALTDVDLWIAAGTLEILAANRNKPALVPLSTSQKELFGRSVGLAIEVVKSRIAPTGIDGGSSLDPGGFDGHPDVAYAGYTQTSAACANCTSVGQCTCPEFPGWMTTADGGRTAPMTPQPGMGLAWDISHARRLVSAFDTFVRHQDVVPGFSEAVVQRFAVQFAEGIWNGSTSDPKFATYFEGSNGWYRVNYSNRSAFGYPPNSMTSGAGACGYGFWAEYEPRIHVALTALDAKLANTSPEYRISRIPELLPYNGRERVCRP
jgi:hypothetical protein